MTYPILSNVAEKTFPGSSCFRMQNLVANSLLFISYIITSLIGRKMVSEAYNNMTLCDTFTWCHEIPVAVRMAYCFKECISYLCSTVNIKLFQLIFLYSLILILESYSFHAVVYVLFSNDCVFSCMSLRWRLMFLLGFFFTYILQLIIKIGWKVGDTKL